MVFLQRNREKTSIWMLFQLVRHICHTLSNHCRDLFLSMISLRFGRTATAMSPCRFPSIKGSPNIGAAGNFRPTQWCASESRWNKICQMTSLCIFSHLFLLFFFWKWFFSKWFNWVITHHKSCPRINRTQYELTGNFLWFLCKKGWYLGI